MFGVVVLVCMWCWMVVVGSLWVVGVGMVGMLCGCGDCCVDVYCRCWLCGCWLFVLIVWVLCVIGLLLVMFVRSIGDVCGVRCGIRR